MSDDPMTVDDLVTGRAAEQLGPGVIPTSAILIVETISDEGEGLRFVQTAGMTQWKAMGMLRSVQLRIEDEDRNGWEGDPDEF